MRKDLNEASDQILEGLNNKLKERKEDHFLRNGEGSQGEVLYSWIMFKRTTLLSTHKQFEQEMQSLLYSDLTQYELDQSMYKFIKSAAALIYNYEMKVKLIMRN